MGDKRRSFTGKQAVIRGETVMIKEIRSDGLVGVVDYNGHITKGWAARSVDVYVKKKDLKGI